MKTTAPYGTWHSPITPEYVAGKERALGVDVRVDGGDIYFIENRPDERGRAVLMRRNEAGEIAEVLPPEFNVRTRYLEYGGISFMVRHGICYFVNFADQEVYEAKPGQAPRRLTNEGGHRFSDFELDEKRERLVALREAPATPESRNTICAIDLKTGRVDDLVQGADFYMGPRIHGERLLWTQWNHPNMSWNGTELFVADIRPGGQLAEPIHIAGDAEHTVSQAQWAPDGSLYFLAEFENWLNLYRYREGEIQNVFPRAAEFGDPEWVTGGHPFAVSENGEVWASFLDHGRKQLIRSSTSRLVGSPFANITTVLPYKNGIVARLSHSDRSATLTYIDADENFHDLYSSAQSRPDVNDISMAEEITFRADDGQTGFAWFYPPVNSRFQGSKNERPPLIVRVHGGPTHISYAELKKDLQFWTSRGFAIVDVNYGGSTGFGRAYRERLRDKWGLVDVQDAVAAVQTLIKEGRVDGKRVAIRGGSAGGYTTLAALTFTKGVFAAGASYFGIGDLSLLAKETHKLESRYMDQLIGPYPEAIKTYKERSPIEHVDQLTTPAIFFQGEEDKAVPPNQAKKMFEALRSKGIPTELHLYPAEGHGFRQAETVQHSLKAEFAFFARFFGIKPQSSSSDTESRGRRPSS